MLLEQTLDKLNAMKLFGLAKSLKERLVRAPVHDGRDSNGMADTIPAA